MSQQWVMEQSSMTIYGLRMYVESMYIPTMLEGFSDIFNLCLVKTELPF